MIPITDPLPDGEPNITYMKINLDGKEYDVEVTNFN
jgi:hypothetical protein